MADLEMCEKYGFDYFEIRYDCIAKYIQEGHTLEELGEWFKNHRINPWAYNTLEYFNQLNPFQTLIKISTFLLFSTTIFKTTILLYPQKKKNSCVNMNL